MAEQILVPASSLVALPRSLDATTAFLVEPLAVAVHGVRRAAIDGSIRVLVMGAGTIGLCAVAAARAAGAEVDLVGRHPAQLAAARQLGAQVIEPADGGGSGGNSGGNYDVVLDCAGTESAIEAACNALRPKGQLVLLSSSWDKLILPGLIIGVKELDIRVSAMYGRSGSVRDIDAAAAILGANDAVADALISDRFPLDRAPEAFERSRDRKGGAIKVVLEP
jgi:2-desacetyl-2-hydroxyethyl bacteriochlorophyllide A dehydrogenase